MDFVSKGFREVSDKLHSIELMLPNTQTVFVPPTFINRITPINVEGFNGKSLVDTPIGQIIAQETKDEIEKMMAEWTPPAPITAMSEQEFTELADRVGITVKHFQWPKARLALKNEQRKYMLTRHTPVNMANCRDIKGLLEQAKQNILDEPQVAPTRTPVKKEEPGCCG